MKPREIDWLGEYALCLRWEARVDPAINAAVHAAAQRLRDSGLDGIRELVPAYASLVLLLDHERLLADPGGGETLRAQVAAILDAPADAAVMAAPRLHEIPVRYGARHGADFDAVCAHAGLSPAALVAAHCAPEYRVAMIGFAPGFPYLLGLDPRLAMPRHAQPRTRVAAGSVGIAGVQTGIYPQAGPGGWQLIGQTPLALFDPGRDPPCLLRAGDRVRFVALAPDGGDRAG